MKFKDDVNVGTYEELRDALLLLRIAAQGEADVETARALPQEEVFTRIQKRLAG